MGPSAGFSGDGGQLPARLEDLRGPWQGVVSLPIHLSWYGHREFDVGVQRSRLQLYSTLLSQGRQIDLVRLVNAQRLSEDWPQLRVLVSRKVRRTCERKLGLRAPAARSHTRRPPGALGPSVCQAEGMRKYVIMGVQGSGKGTQSQLLAADLDLVHISVGDIFRWNVQNHTKIGAQVRRVMAAGELVGDDLVESVVRERLTGHDWNYGFIVDGFPRNCRQAEFFVESYDIDGVIALDLPDSEVRRRVLSRRVCEGCGINYNLIDSTPAVPGQCDACGGQLTTREDDTDEALAVRLRDYHEKTAPVLDLFRRKEYVISVDARPPAEVVQAEIRQRLGLPPQKEAQSA